MTGYLCDVKGEASLARKGWLAIIRAAGRVDENNLQEALDSYGVIQLIIRTWE